MPAPLGLDAIVTQLQNRYTTLLADYLAMPAVTFSEGGTSISVDRAAVKAQLEDIRAELAALGFPVGTVGVPYLVVTSCQ